MKHLNIKIEGIFYDKKKNTTVITGWALGNPDFELINFAASKKLNGTFKRIWRAEVNEIFRIPNDNWYGFKISLDGDLIDSNEKVVFKTKNKEISVPIKKLKKLNEDVGLEKAKSYLKNYGPLRSLKRYLLKEKQPNPPYMDWIEKYEKDNLKIETPLKNKPLISIVVPVYNIDEQWLRKCIDSVLNQTYTNWQLCMADDCSTDPRVIEVLKEYHQKDSRIDYTRRKENGHISKATNSAIKIAKGDYIGFMDNDDELAPNALYEVVKLINKDPDIEFIYTDEDKVTETGIRFDPFFKPDWNSLLLKSHNYITHFVVVKRNVIDKIGMLRSEYNGSQDYDFVLRATRAAKKVGHIPKILYHWRTITGSVADNPEAKDYAYINGQKALQDYLDTDQLPAETKIGINYGTYDITYKPKEKLNVTIIIIDSDDPNLMPINLYLNELIRLTDYLDYSILVVNPIESIENKDIKVIYNNARRSEAELYNYAAKEINTDRILFLNRCLIPKSNDWLSQMVNISKSPKVGIVGCKIINQAYTVLQAGVTVRNNLRYVPQTLRHALSLGYYYRLSSSQEVFAVSSLCMMVERNVFIESGGFDSTLSKNAYDIDLSIRFRILGYSTAYCADAIMIQINDDNLQFARIDDLIQKYKQQPELLRDSYININIGPEGSADSFVCY